MSRSIELLRMLVETHAFDPMPLPGYRDALYVPFEELVEEPCETRLSEEVVRLERVAVIGPVGAGKSSLIEHVLGQRAPDAAPLVISASHENEQTLTDHVEFARHMIREIVGWARDVDAMTEREARAARGLSAASQPGVTAIKTQTIGVKLALKWMEPSWTRELQETLPNPEVERSRGEFVDSLTDLVDFIYDVGRTPVVVIDDSDRWLRLEPAARERVMEGFFGETARMLAEQNWSVVMAVHPEYCASRSFRAALAQGYLTSQIEIPRLLSSARLMTLLSERVARRVGDETTPHDSEQFTGAVAVEDVFGAGCERLMYERYASTDGDIRRLLTVVHQALAEAVRATEDHLRADVLEETILALS